MKEFKKVTQNDLVLEFLKFVNKKLGVDVDKLEVTKYNEYIDNDFSTFFESKSMYIELNNCEYYVRLLHNGVEMNTTLNIWQTDYENIELLYERVFKEIK